MHTYLPNLLPSRPSDRTFPIVGRALGFDIESDTRRMNLCVYLLVKDTCTMENHPDIDVAMQDAPMGSGVAESEDATEIKCAFWNASIGGCKDALPAFHSIDDDEDEGNGEDHVDACMSNDLSFGGVGSAGASHISDSNPLEYSK